MEGISQSSKTVYVLYKNASFKLSNTSKSVEDKKQSNNEYEK